jgi:hypothetical protein
VIDVYDVQGRAVDHLHGVFGAGTPPIVTLSYAGHPTGMYFARVIDAAGHGSPGLTLAIVR